MSAAAAPDAQRAEALLRITLAALNARPMFRLGHVGDRLPIRNSYELASAIEQYFNRDRKLHAVADMPEAGDM